MNINEIVGRLKAGGLDASSTNRGAAVYVTEVRSGRAEPGWFGFRIICNSEATERRVRSILSRWYDIDANGNVWRLKSKNRVPLMAIKRGGVPPTPPTPTGDYMYFEAAQANSTVSMMSTLATAPDLEYSTDGETWQVWQHTTAEGTHTFDTLTLTNIGDRVYLRGENPNGFLDIQNVAFSLFSMTGKIAAHGNAQSLVDGDTPTLVAKTMPMFSDMAAIGEPNDVLVSAPSLPATTLAERCYNGMFSGCTGLTQAPSLPATTLAEGCYYAMFSDCTGLTNAPSLPATTLAERCYSVMFGDCTGLTQTPSLPATTLAEHCYNGMFSGCTGLTQAPSLPATTLAEECYTSMFYGCTGLTQAPSLPATTLAEGCYYAMFSNCTGLTNAPSLPATTLAERCYSVMFGDCTFAMSNDGTTFNFAFGATPPVTVGEETYNTYYDIAQWMGNTNGFTTP